MRVVVALGGNALLKRGEPLTAEVQRANIRTAVQALAPVAKEHQLVISHGNGPQVGLLVLQGAAYKPDEAYPLDALVPRQTACWFWIGSSHPNRSRWRSRAMTMIFA